MMQHFQKLFSTVMFLLVAFTTGAQEDITGQYLQNAGLSMQGSGWDYGDNGYDYTAWNTGGDVPAVEFYYSWSTNAGANIGSSRSFHFTQTVILPAGDYRIAVNAFYREGNGNGTNTKAYIFAGDKQQFVHALTAAEQADITGVSGKYVGSSDLLRAANAFSKGDFSNAFDFTVETQQEITLGFRGYIDTYCSWCTLGPVKLYRYSFSDYLVEYSALVGEANALTGKMGAAERQALSDAIVAESTFNSSAELVVAINSLTEAIAAARKSIADYAPLVTLFGKVAEIKSNVEDAAAIAAFDEAVASVQDAYEAGSLADFATARTTVANALSALVKCQTANNSDFTFVIINPNVDGESGWTCEIPYGGNGPMLGSDKFEYWAGDTYNREEASFDYHQEITGLPEGYYTVSALMYNSLNDEGGSYTVFSPTAGVYAASGANEVIAFVDEDGTTLTAYTTEPIMVTNGMLRIGVKNAITPMAARWFVADEFHLTLVRRIGGDEGDIPIDANHFPDDAFREYLTESFGSDGLLSADEIEGIDEIDVEGMDIQSLMGIEYFSNLEYLYCSNNQLISLDLSRNTALYEVSCSNNQLTSLILQQSDNLTYLDCSNNSLYTLNVSGCPNLESLVCFGNSLTELDLTHNEALTYIDCSGNKLTNLYVSENSTFTQLYSYDNKIKDYALDELISSLPAATAGKLYFLSSFEDGNACTSAQVAAALAKGWTIYSRNGTTWTAKVGATVDEASYNRALTTIRDGMHYRIFTEVGGTKYYLTEEGTLSASTSDIASFGFNKVEGEEYEYGFQLDESFFSNPDMGSSGNVTLHSGYIRNHTTYQRNTWEAQVFFLNEVGRYAIRSTNAYGGDYDWALAAKTFWTVNSSEAGPVAEYAVSENFIWQIEEDPSYVEVALNLVYGGQTIATKSSFVKVGSTIDVPSEFNNGLVSFSQDVETIASNTRVVNFTAEWGGLFEFSDNYANAKWYNMTIRYDYFVGMDLTEPYHPTADKELWDETNQWAFMGNPYNFVVINRAAGATKSLAVDGSNVVMREGVFTWEAFDNSDGFAIRRKNSEDWVNQYGSTTGPLQIWSSASGHYDEGSVLRALEIPDRSIYEEMLSAAVAQAESVEGLIPRAANEALQSVVVANDQEWAKIAQYNAAVNAINAAVEQYASTEIREAYSRYLALAQDFETVPETDGLEEREEGALAAYQQAMTSANELVEATTSTDALVEASTEAKATMREALLTLLAVVAPADGHPLDITFLLENPDFEEGGEPMMGVLPGWMCTFVKGQTATNIGYMPNAYNGNGISSAVGDAYVNGDVSIQHFMEAWQDNSGSRVIGDGKLYQTLSGLPVGWYRLTTDAIAVNQYDSSKNPVTGAYIYIQSGQIETATEIHTGNGLPEHFEVDFINDHAESLDFGLKTISSTANWIAADNFYIYYVSELKESPGVASLKEMLALYEDVTFGPCELAALSSFTAEREHAIEMTETDIYSLAHSSECLEEKAILQNKYNDVLASVAAYESYQQSVNKVLARLNSVQDANSPLAHSLTDLADELQQGINDGNAVASRYQNIDNQISDIVNYWKFHFSESDLAILRAALQQMGSQPAWENRWNLNAEQLSLDGITNTEGRVTAVQLNGRGLTGSVPTALFALEKTSSFNLSGNKLSSIQGSVPQGKTLNIRNQQLDQVVNVNIGNNDASLVLAQLPSILCYQNSAGGATSHFAFNVVGENYRFTLSENNGTLQVTSRSSYIYQGEKNAVMACTSTYGDAAGSTFSLRFTFDDGDANFDGALDVLDLQTNINYIMEKYQSRPYNFTAANLWVDDAINVQDVILQINLLMETEQPLAEGSVKRNAPSVNGSSEAYLFVEDGHLMLSTETPVAAFDIIVSGIDEMRPSADLIQSGITCSMKNVASGVRIIGYSLADAVLPVGVSIIAKLNEASASVVSARLADSEANAISVKANQQGLPTALGDIARQSADTEAIYDMQGRKISKNSYMPKGLYIQNGRKVVKK